MKTYTIRILENSTQELTNAIELLHNNCPSESERYEKCRLIEEINSIDKPPFYKKFFGAFQADDTLIGVGGIKAADWASDTHILYMMAVDIQHRGKGVGSALESSRIQWVREHYAHGRCLVSTRHKKRFERWHFHIVSEINQRYLMLLEF